MKCLLEPIEIYCQGGSATPAGAIVNFIVIGIKIWVLSKAYVELLLILLLIVVPAEIVYVDP